MTCTCDELGRECDSCTAIEIMSGNRGAWDDLGLRFAAASLFDAEVARRWRDSEIYNYAKEVLMR